MQSKNTEKAPGKKGKSFSYKTGKPSSVADARLCLPNMYNQMLSARSVTNDNERNDEERKQGKVPQQNLDAGQLVAKELQSLSATLREDALHDVHGVATMPEEDPEQIPLSLKQLETGLLHLRRQTNFSSDDAAALQLAMQQSPDYVRSLFLMFLRCCRFQVEQTVKCLSRYFEVKLWLFGTKKLCFEITQSDFSFTGLRLLRAGYFQLLQSRDTSNRVILVINPWCEAMERHEPENVPRILWYLIMTALKDKTTQKHGMVVILSNVAEESNPSAKALTEIDCNLITMSIQSSPIRLVAFHCCYSNPAFYTSTISMIVNAFGRHVRARTKFHQGASWTDVRIALSGYGIPVTFLPYTTEGKLTVREHSKWIKTRQSIEKEQRRHPTACVYRYSVEGGGIVEIEEARSSIVIPDTCDVILGRGQSRQTRMGNVHLSRLVKEKLDEYTGKDSDPRTHEEKAAIVNDIISAIKREGRFLKQDERDGRYTQIVDNEVIFRKIQHDFRNKKPQRVKKKKRTMTPKSHHHNTKVYRSRDNDDDNNDDDDDDDDDDDESVETSSSRDSPSAGTNTVAKKLRTSLDGERSHRSNIDGMASTDTSNDNDSRVNLFETMMEIADRDNQGDVMEQSIRDGVVDQPQKGGTA